MTLAATASRPAPGLFDAGVDELAIATIRALSMDAVERARSGHPGLPMAMAPVAHVLYTRFMRHDPATPDWPDRDRFVLSAGHGSMLLYSVLHLTGYDLPMRQLERFRQWGSLTPGHPEHGHGTPGVETTTGPLGQGFANGVGMAMAERFLRERYGPEVMDHRVFAICSDGDLMEGVAAEAASLAGHLGLGRLVYVYDDNRITIDGSTEKSFATEDVEARFRAYGWHTCAVDDANDLDVLHAQLQAAIDEQERPSLVRVRSEIAWPAPSKRGTAAAHGAPLGAEEVRATKELMGFDPDVEFAVPEAVAEVARACRAHGAAARRGWEARMSRWRAAHPDRADEWDRAWGGRPARPLREVLPSFDPGEASSLATRAAGSVAMAAFAPEVPTMVGGAADLAESTKTEFPGEPSFTREHAGRNVHFGVREHAMGAAVNGLALHGGIVRPYGSTFLIFSDYMRPAIRLSALMQLPVAWVLTHDSVGLGEDGPTHQPVELYAALRAIPGLTVLRPADAAETADAWRVIVEELPGPACLLLTRQGVPVLDRGERRPLADPEVGRGAYVLAEAPARPDAIIVATGSEVAVALAARDLLAAEGDAVRVVSMPSWELFAAQDAGYREAVLPVHVPTVAVEAGVPLGWSAFADRTVGIDRFGASAPGPEAMERLGITPEHVATAARDLLARREAA
jgi:transketolase